MDQLNSNYSCGQYELAEIQRIIWQLGHFESKFLKELNPHLMEGV